MFSFDAILSRNSNPSPPNTRADVLRGSYSNQQFYKKSRNLIKYLVVYFVFVLYLKRGGKEGEEKRKGVVGEIFF